LLKTIGRIVEGCFFVLVALLLAAIVVEKIVRRVKVYRFRRRFRGKSLLICSRRHGWHDFIVNNVVPALPDDCTVEWTQSFRGWDPIVVALRWWRIRGERPLLVHVGKRVRGVSLQKELLPLRGIARKDAETRRRVAEIVAAAQREIA
jgi:hypothetical protein